MYPIGCFFLQPEFRYEVNTIRVSYNLVNQFAFQGSRSCRCGVLLRSDWLSGRRDNRNRAQQSSLAPYAAYEIVGVPAEVGKVLGAVRQVLQRATSLLQALQTRCKRVEIFPMSAFEVR